MPTATPLILRHLLPSLPKSAPTAVRCRRVYRLPSKSGPSSAEWQVHPLPSSNVSLPHEYRSNGCCATRSCARSILILRFPISFSTLVESIQFLPKYAILLSTWLTHALHLTPGRPRWATRCAPTLGYTLRAPVGLCSVSPRSDRRDHHTWIQSLLILLVSGITHDITLLSTVSWSSPLEKHP